MPADAGSYGIDVGIEPVRTIATGAATTIFPPVPEVFDRPTDSSSEQDVRSPSTWSIQSR